MNLRRFLTVCLALLAAVAGALLVPSEQSAAPAATGFPGGPNFALSHRNNDDPIVFPGQPGRSHNHTFIGHRGVDASSTPESLLGGATTCGSSADSSAYWMPTLYVDRVPIYPVAGIVYYIRRTSARIVPLPAGLKMVAGNAGAHHRQPKGIVAWSCGTYNPESADFGRVGGRPRYSTVPACRDDSRAGPFAGSSSLLQLQVTFPSCWSGKALDSVDHKQHMAYASAGRCPASHPQAVPTIALIVLYAPVSSRARVASGRFGAHADFMNGWDQDELSRLVAGLN